MLPSTMWSRSRVRISSCSDRSSRAGSALVATAVGLVVALPAVATYNAFTRHVESATSNADAISHEILSVLKTVDIPKEG